MYVTLLDKAVSSLYTQIGHEECLSFPVTPISYRKFESYK